MENSENTRIQPAKKLTFHPEQVKIGALCRPASGENPFHFGVLGKYASGVFYIQYASGHVEVLSIYERVTLK